MTSVLCGALTTPRTRCTRNYQYWCNLIVYRYCHCRTQSSHAWLFSSRLISLLSSSSMLERLRICAGSLWRHDPAQDETPLVGSSTTIPASLPHLAYSPAKHCWLSSYHIAYIWVILGEQQNIHNQQAGPRVRFLLIGLPDHLRHQLKDSAFISLKFHPRK